MFELIVDLLRADIVYVCEHDLCAAYMHTVCITQLTQKTTLLKTRQNLLGQNQTKPSRAKSDRTRSAEKFFFSGESHA